MSGGYLSAGGGGPDLTVQGGVLTQTGRAENWHGIDVDVARLRDSFGAGNIDFVLAFDPPLNLEGTTEVPISSFGAALIGSGVEGWNPGVGVTLTLPAGNNGGNGEWDVTSGIRIVVNSVYGTVHPSITLRDIRIGGSSIF